MYAEETPLIRLDDAIVMREGHVILAIDRLDLHAGEHVAILGPNGAGKSTLLGLITREVRPVAHKDGTAAVLLAGRQHWDLFEARRRIGVVSDVLQDAYRKPVNVRDAVLSGFFGSVGVYRRGETTPEMHARVDWSLASLGIETLADRGLDTLSTGEARRVLIARALVHDPPMLVLDEPTHGLDPSAAHSFRALLRRLAASGRTLVLVTHHVDDVVPEVERVVMLKEGHVFRDGPKADILTSEGLSGLFGFPAHLECRAGEYRLW